MESRSFKTRFKTLLLAASLIALAGCEDDDDETSIRLAGSAAFAEASYSVAEEAGTLSVTVNRVDGDYGDVSVTVKSNGGSADVGDDYTEVVATLSWADGDTAPKSFDVAIVDETLSEADETITLSITDTVGIDIGSPGSTTVTIVNADLPTVTGLDLEILGRYQSGVFDEGAAEIVAFDPSSGFVFVVNADAATVDVLDIADPSNPTKVGEIDATEFGAGANSIAVANGLLAVAIEADPKTDPGVVVIYDTASLTPISQVAAGALPDMVTFTPDGATLLVANEGEPNDDYSIDPAGTVTVIDVTNPEAPVAATAGFTAFDGSEGALRAEGIRIYGPNASASQDFEPEYIAVSADSSTAYVTLQENNALAIVDLATATVADVIPLGYKDHSVDGSGLDASDRDDAINIASWPVFGMYQPDAIASFSVGGADYLITANEGDAREYITEDELGEEVEVFVEETRIEDLTLDAATFPNAAELQTDAAIGRLNATNALGDTDGDGDFDALYVLGGRSFSIWSGADGSLVYDSGDLLEQITAEELPEFFNSNNDENDTFDNRSDNKGPEPEGVTVATFGNSVIAFVGLERVGGIVAFDVTDPTTPVFLDYLNPRDFSVADVEDDLALVGDLGPEGLVVIPADTSPSGAPLLVVGNEVSGTTAVYAINLTTE